MSKKHNTHRPTELKETPRNSDFSSMCSSWEELVLGATCSTIYCDIIEGQITVSRIAITVPLDSYFNISSGPQLCPSLMSSLPASTVLTSPLPSPTSVTAMLLTTTTQLPHPSTTQSSSTSVAQLDTVTVTSAKTVSSFALPYTSSAQFFSTRAAAMTTQVTSTPRPPTPTVVISSLARYDGLLRKELGAADLRISRKVSLPIANKFMHAGLSCYLQIEDDEILREIQIQVSITNVLFIFTMLYP